MRVFQGENGCILGPDDHKQEESSDRVACTHEATTVTATGTSLNKRLNEKNNGCARAL